MNLNDLIKLGVFPPTRKPKATTVTLVAHAYATGAGDLGRILEVAPGPANATITLMSAAMAGDGAVQYLHHNDSGTAILGTADNGSGLIRLQVASTANFTTGDTRVISGIATGTVEANGPWQITVIDATHIDLNNSNFTNAWTSGGVISAGYAIVSDGVNDVVWLGTYGDFVALESNGAAWRCAWKQLADQWIIASTPGTTTPTMPPLYVRVYAEVIGGGGGGGSGRCGATNTARSGGTGGNPGIYNDGHFSAAQVGTAPVVTVGAKGTGGTLQAGPNLDGNPGNTGNTSNFAGLLTAGGGSPGKGGSSAAVTSPSSQAATSKYSQSAVGGAASVTADAASVTISGVAPGPGGAGACLTSGNAEFAPSAGGAGGRIFSTLAQGTAGAKPTTGTGNPGGAGKNKGEAHSLGGGGAGGATGGAGAGGAGGAGGNPGGGGGGGAASLNGANSGAGGDGADGAVRVRIGF